VAVSYTHLDVYKRQLDESGHTRFVDKIFAGVKRVPIS